ncbi:hypothetical protein [Flavobacterium sp.]|jgi:hypothetical protein|uniref:hypothetical protein n=1 Tax=Flavobacterium sp. TaxID=239 RepID=UPI0022C5E6B1|nr:hypothetical protein [Flavobacterium sp.]MCZ8089020.1 hypothetical protein [Flavobacterium sp.]
MKIYNADFKIIRLDFNIEILKTKPLMESKAEIVLELFPASDGIKDACKFGFRIASHFLEINSKKEAVGYLSEYFSDFVIENKAKDVVDIKRFVENAFLNHEVQFQDNKPAEVIMDNLILNPNIDGFTEDVFSHLKKHGYYPE